MNSCLLSYVENDDEDFFSRISESQQARMNKVLCTQEQLHRIAQGNLSSVDGIPKIHDGTVYTFNNEKKAWEIFEDDACSIISCNASLDSLLEGNYYNNEACSKVFGSSYVDDDTMSTCSMSDTSVCSEGSAVSFVSTNSNGTAKSNCTRGKRQLRAIASMIDPDMKRKIRERRGLWSGCFDDEDKVYEHSVEVPLRKPMKSSGTSGHRRRSGSKKSSPDSNRRRKTKSRKDRKESRAAKCIRSQEEEEVCLEAIEVVCQQLHPDFKPPEKKIVQKERKDEREHMETDIMEDEVFEESIEVVCMKLRPDFNENAHHNEKIKIKIKSRKGLFTMFSRDQDKKGLKSVKENGRTLYEV